MPTTSLWILAEAREGVGVEGVVVEEHRRRRLHDLVRLRPGVVDHPEGAAVLPAGVAAAVAR